MAKGAMAVGGAHLGLMAYGIISGAHDYRVKTPFGQSFHCELHSSNHLRGRYPYHLYCHRNKVKASECAAHDQQQLGKPRLGILLCRCTNFEVPVDTFSILRGYNRSIQCILAAPFYDTPSLNRLCCPALEKVRKWDKNGHT